MRSLVGNPGRGLSCFRERAERKDAHHKGIVVAKFLVPDGWLEEVRVNLRIVVDRMAVGIDLIERVTRSGSHGETFDRLGIEHQLLDFAKLVFEEAAAVIKVRVKVSHKVEFGLRICVKADRLEAERPKLGGILPARIFGLERLRDPHVQVDSGAASEVIVAEADALVCCVECSYLYVGCCVFSYERGADRVVIMLLGVEADGEHDLVICLEGVCHCLDDFHVAARHEFLKEDRVRHHAVEEFRDAAAAVCKERGPCFVAVDVHGDYALRRGFDGFGDHELCDL